MGRIVAIGGGELRLGETKKLDQLIVSLTKKISPNLLFLPTASYDAEEYIHLIEEYFTKLGCIVDVLCLHSCINTPIQIREKILSADIIYVGGGDTVRMIDCWEQFGVCRLLKQAYHQGAVLSGLSAGSICWFDFGYSDSDLFQNNGQWNYILTNGLGLIPAAHCPHYNEPDRKGFDDIMMGATIPGVALEDGTALVEEDGIYFIAKEQASCRAFLLTPQNGHVQKRELADGEMIQFVP